MKTKTLSILFLFLIFPLAAKADVQCKMHFTLKSWSIIYKNGKGSGTVSCNNGYSASVKLKAHGAGLSIGKSTVQGVGHFTGVDKVEDLFGTYASAQAHAGAKKSGRAQALTKGEVSLTLTGKGKGFDLGFAIGGLTIKKR